MESSSFLAGCLMLHRNSLLATAVLIGAVIAHSAAAGEVPLYSGLGAVHHPVTTSSPLAQKYFDQGLAFTYGFNHDEAELSFEQAAKLDPKMAMAPWGTALVLGQTTTCPKTRSAVGKLTMRCAAPVPWRPTRRPRSVT